MSANEYAFPGTDSLDHLGSPTYPGLTKREWFAGMALQGLLANHAFVDCYHPSAVVDAVQAADALLAELEKEESA